LRPAAALVREKRTPRAGWRAPAPPGQATSPSSESPPAQLLLPPLPQSLLLQLLVAPAEPGAGATPCMASGPAVRFFGGRSSSSSLLWSLASLAERLAVAAPVP